MLWRVVKKISNVCDNSWKPKVSLSVTVSHCFLVFYTVSWYFTLFPGILHCFLVFHNTNIKCYYRTLRAAKRCERCERCSCKDFPTGVKILVENVMKGGVNKCQVFVTTAGKHKCLCLWLFHTVSWYFSLFPGVSHCFSTCLVLKCRESRTFDSTEFVVNHILFV